MDLKLQPLTYSNEFRKPTNDLRETAAYLRLNRDGDGQESQVLVWDSLSHVFQRTRQWKAYPGLLCNDAQFAADRIAKFRDHHLQCALERMASLERRFDEVKHMGQLLVECLQPSLPLESQISERKGSRAGAKRSSPTAGRPAIRRSRLTR